jgi:cephalosporin hydroxylase
MDHERQPFFTRFNELFSNKYRLLDKPLRLISRLSYIDLPKDEISYYSPWTVYNGHHQGKYRGIPMLKCPFDYVIYQMLICELQPDLIIEIGTNLGGAAYYMADLLNNLGHGIVHSIDIADNCEDVVKSHPRIKLFTDGWQNYDLNNAKNYNKILIIEDSVHSYQNTLDALNYFHTIVSVGSYFIVEDGVVNQIGYRSMYNGGPIKAIKEFLGKHDSFVIDENLENFYGTKATFNLNGYLKRIR